MLEKVETFKRVQDCAVNIKDKLEEIVKRVCMTSDAAQSMASMSRRIPSRLTMASIDEASAEKIFNEVLDCWGLELSRIVACSSHWQFTTVKKDDKLHVIYLTVDDGLGCRWIKSCRSFNEIYSGFIDDLIDINSKVWKHSVACFEWSNASESWQSQKRVWLCKSGDALPEKLCVMLDLAAAK